MTMLYSELKKLREKSVRVTLTPEQMECAAVVGRARNDLHRSNNRADGNVNGASVATDVYGAQAELAVCVAFNRPWVNAIVPLERWDNERRLLHDMDQIEVKSTLHEFGCLLVQKQFDDDAPYVLVVAKRAPIFRLAGWLYGHEVKRPEYWRTDVPRPCYMAPQSALRAMNEL